MTPFEQLSPQTNVDTEGETVSLFNKMDLNGDFDRNKGPGSKPDQSWDGRDALLKSELPLPQLELDFHEVAEAAPSGSEVVDFNAYRNSYDNAIRLCAGGTTEKPLVVDHGNGASTLYFTDSNNVPVVVQRRETLIRDEGSPVPNRSANLVHKRIEFLNLDEGVTAAVELTPPTLDERLDHRLISPRDNYQISVVDRNEGTAYKYSFPKSLGDGTTLRQDLELLRQHHRNLNEQSSMN